MESNRRTRWGVTFSQPLADAIADDALSQGLTPGRYLSLLVGAVYDDVESVERLRARDGLASLSRYKRLRQAR